MKNAEKNKELPPLPLPGEPSVDDTVCSMIRVDQAGEFGAVRIYKGQLDVLGEDHPDFPTIKHMAEQEDVHLEKFNSIVAERGVRPTMLQPLWHVAGYALGATTALMGPKAAMACTAAVEEVIDEHYQSQREQLNNWGIEEELSGTIEKFQSEEAEHREIALEKGAEETPGYRLLSDVIKAGCRTAIWMSKRV